MSTPAPTTTDAPQFSLRALLITVTVVALVIGMMSTLAAYLNRMEAARQAELVQLAESDKATLIAIVRDVEAARTKLGRVPNNEEELESLLGRPMPVVHDGTYLRPVNYRRTGENSFHLQYELWATDDWIYDSNAPSAGWVQHWY